MHFSFAQLWEVVENGAGGLVEAVGMVWRGQEGLFYYACMAREPCKCCSRAVQVSLASRASVSREPYKCLSKGARGGCLEGVGWRRDIWMHGT